MEAKDKIIWNNIERLLDEKNSFWGFFIACLKINQNSSCK
jgi:hypothetical protein